MNGLTSLSGNTPPCPTPPQGLLPAEGPVEEDLSQWNRDGVPGPQVLAENLPQLHCGKRACQLAAKERHHLQQVETDSLHLFLYRLLSGCLTPPVCLVGPRLLP